MDNITELWKSIVRLAVKQARQVTDDKEALAIKILYKQWIAQLGRTLEVGEYVQHDGELYRVLQQHVVQGNWVPGIGTESLYMIIDREHEGILEDPIPWRGNMECFLGKYYIEDGILYECIRDSGIALHHKVVELIDNYFVIYNENIEEDDNIENGDNENTENGNEGDNNKEDEIVVPEDNPDINNGENEDNTEGGDENTNDGNIENGDGNNNEGDNNGEDDPVIPEDNPNVDNGEGRDIESGNENNEGENVEIPEDNGETIEPEGDNNENTGNEGEPTEPEPEETEIGTLENPIDVTNASLPIVYELDKYYKEGNVIYKCTRAETLHFLPSSLVGHYFEIV